MLTFEGTPAVPGSRARRTTAAPTCCRCIFAGLASSPQRALARSLLILVVLAATLVFANAATAAVVAVQVTDALSALPLGGKRVVIYEKSASGALTWRRAGTTDAGGRVRLALADAAPGAYFVARCQAFAQWVERDVPASGAVTLPAGQVDVDVRHGVSGAPLRSTLLTLVTVGTDGKYAGVAAVTTDADGHVRLDPPALGQTVYALRGASPIDGSLKYSTSITAPGRMTFDLGNPPVTVRLTDWATTAPLAGQHIEFRERLADGSSKWIAARNTDGDGRVRIDLDGFDAGRRYVMRATPYLQAIEREITTPGWLGVRAGTVTATVLNGDSGLPLANAEVYLLTRLADGTHRYEFKTVTDAAGLLRLDPVALGVNDYVLRAPSLVDGSLKYSALIRKAGALTFAVGNRGLSVRVQDARNDVPLGSLSVIAHEVFKDGKRGPGILRTTDASGVAHFDLDGLGSGRSYVLRTQPFQQWIERSVASAGWVEIAAGSLRVALVHGVSGKALANKEVKLLAVQPDGSRRTLLTTASKADGSLMLDPPDLGHTPYVLSAASPTDGSTKYSETILAPGDISFAVGGAGVLVQVTDWTSKAALSGLTVSAFARNEDGAEVWAAGRTTDDLGRARFDLDGLGSGRTYIIKVRPYRQTITREITATGFLGIRAGSVRVAVRRGDTGAALTNTPVKVLSILPDGNYEHVTTLASDALGELILDPHDIGTTHYVLRAASPVDGSLKYSAPVTHAGPVQFDVGNKALRVTLVDQPSQAQLPLHALQVIELQADDKRTWVRQTATDAHGQAVFDLDGLGSGRRYLVRTRPYAQWLEQTVIDTGDLMIEAGRSPVTLIDGDNGAPLAGVTVRALNKAPDGTLLPAFGSATTDANGVIRFDPHGLETGAAIVYAAVDPFATGAYYYSTPTISAGPMTFAVSRSGPAALDRTPAELTLTQPRHHQAVGNAGFVFTGSVRDKAGLREVAVEVRHGSTVIGRGLAVIDPDIQRWTARLDVPAVPPDTSLTVTVVATDLAYNASTETVQVKAVEDVTPPTITFRSPAEGASVNGLGTLVLGNVRDDTQWAALTIRLDSAAGTLAAARAVEIDPISGDWALAIPVDFLRTATNVTIHATATDVSGNTASATRQINIDSNADSLRHLLSRITFGASPELYAETRTIGAYAYLDQQLAPTLIDDSALESRLHGLPPTTLAQLQHRTLLRMTTSRRQLNEMMTWFWENHFNTDFRRHGQVEWEQHENDAFRSHALGRFRDLLAVSARSPAMLRYLDNASSHKRNPNENYAREALELHTLASGYTQQDVDEAARAFTGWTVIDNRFAFSDASHDPHEKHLLGVRLPAGGGQQDGETLIDLLAAHPNTAQHVCTKLTQLFVADRPPPALVTRCVNTFRTYRDASDQIARAVRTVINSAEFRAAEHRGNKAKTSLEFLIGLVRGTQALGTGADLARLAGDLGQPLYTYPVPNGYSLEATAWTGPYLLRQRLAFVGQTLETKPNGILVHADPAALLAGTPAVKTTEGVAARMLQNALGGTFDAADLATAIAVLTDHGARRFTLDADDGPARVRRLARTVLSLPRYQMR